MQTCLAILSGAVCGAIIGGMGAALLIAVSTPTATAQANSGYNSAGAGYAAWLHIGIGGLIGFMVGPLLSSYLIRIGMPLFYLIPGSVLLAGWSIVLCPDVKGLGPSWQIPGLLLSTVVGGIGGLGRYSKLKKDAANLKQYQQLAAAIQNHLDLSSALKISRNQKNNLLIVAAQKGNADVVEALLEGGADVNAADNFGYTALIKAASRSCPEVVKLLIEAGADIHEQAIALRGNTLRSAASCGSTEVVQALNELPRRKQRGISFKRGLIAHLDAVADTPCPAF